MTAERYISQYAQEFMKLDRKFWNYEDGCVLTGLEAMYKATGRKCYAEAVRVFLDRYICPDGRIRWYDREEYSLDKIPSGRGLLFLYRETGQEKYRLAAKQLMEQLRRQPRTESGSFWHKKIYPRQIWLDGLYMGQPFYMEYENRFNERKNYSDIMNQFNQARKLLFDEKTGLYYHAYDEYKDRKWADPVTGLSPNFWLRSIGWYLMALVDCCELASEEIYEVKARFGELLREAVHGILTYQDQESRLFYQLPALPEQEGNYLETSGSLMVAYAVLKGCRLGVLLEEKYAARGREIYNAVLEQKIYQADDGAYHLSGTCAVAGLGPRTERDGSIAYYLSEPVVDDDVKAMGVLMMVTAELMKME